MSIVKIGLIDPDTGKFLQVYLDKTPYLVLGNYIGIHAKIFEKFLKIRCVGFETVRLRGPEFGPSLKGQRYELVGAGVFDIVDDEISLHGKSGGYNMGPDKNHAQELSKLAAKKL